MAGLKKNRYSQYRSKDLDNKISVVHLWQAYFAISRLYLT